MLMFFIFEKFVMTRGIIFAAMPDVSDIFVSRVVLTLEQMIPVDFSNENDGDAQLRMMDAMARKKTLIPIVKGEDAFENFSPEIEEQLDSVWDEYSACDVIFELDSGDMGQPMEIFEHLLHSITVIGLHYMDFEDWGISDSSTLYGGWQQATNEGLYNADYDDEIG